MLRAVVSALLQYGIAQVLLVEHGVRRRAGRMLRGVLFLLFGGLAAGLVLLCGLLALFFQLADMTELVTPALVTGGVGLLISVALILEGIYLMRGRP